MRASAPSGYLLLPTVEERLESGDYEAAYAAASAAAAIGERCGDLELVDCTRHQQGRIRLQQGQFEAGLEFLDETMVTVTAGELSPLVTGLMRDRSLQAMQTNRKFNDIGVRSFILSGAPNTSATRSSLDALLPDLLDAQTGCVLRPVAHSFVTPDMLTAGTLPNFLTAGAVGKDDGWSLGPAALAGNKTRRKRIGDAREFLAGASQRHRALLRYLR